MDVVGWHLQAVKAITRPLGGASEKDRGDLLAALPGDEIAGAQVGADQQDDLVENVVAFGVFEEIVDAFEVVDVKHCHRNWTSVAAGLGDYPWRGLERGAAVGQAGEGIGRGGFAQAVEEGDALEGQASGLDERGEEQLGRQPGRSGREVNTQIGADNEGKLGFFLEREDFLCGFEDDFGDLAAGCGRWRGGPRRGERRGTADRVALCAPGLCLGYHPDMILSQRG